MPEHCPDLVKTGATAKHRACGRVAKHMCAMSGREDPGSDDGSPNHPSHASWSEMSDRSDRFEEHLRHDGFLPSGLQVCEDRVADVLGKRQPCLATIFACDAHASTGPIDRIEGECTHVARTESKPREREDDRPVSEPDCRAHVT